MIGFNSRITQNAPGQINLQTEAVARLMADLSQAAALTSQAAAAPPQTEASVTIGKK